MTTFRFVIIALSAVTEVFLFSFGVLGLLAFRGDPNPSVPTAMIVSFMVCAAFMLSLTAFSYFRAVRNREKPILYWFLLKIPAAILWLGVSWLALGIPEASLVALVAAILITGLIIFIKKASEDSKYSRPVKQSGAQERVQFKVEKAEWAWDDAAAEYRRLQGAQGTGINGAGAEGQHFRGNADHGPQEFSDDDNEKIYAYAGTPTAYFLGWLIKRGYVSDEFLRTHSPEAVQAVRDETMTPPDFFSGCMDYVLVREDLSPEILQFVDLYYRYDNEGAPFHHSTKRYFFDYYKVICSGFDVPRYYCVDFTWNSFRRLAEVLDRRLHAFRRTGPYEEAFVEVGEELRCPCFDKGAGLFAEPDTPPAYFRKCAEAYVNMSEALQLDLSNHLVEMCDEDVADEDLTPAWVLRHFVPEKVIVCKPQDDLGSDVPAFVAVGGSEWDGGHGLMFTVIGDFVVDFAFYPDAMPPWDEDMKWKYRIRKDAASGRVCAAEVIPARFGGRRDSADNQITIPVAAAERKRQYEDLIEALYALGMARSYDCRITYDGGRPNYLFIAAMSADRRVFADSIPVS